MDHTSAETNHNINSAFGPGTANGVEHSSGSRSFAKEMRALKMRSVVASHQKLTDQLEAWSM